MEQALSIESVIECLRKFPLVTVVTYTCDGLPCATLLCSNGVIIEDLPVSYLQAVYNHRLMPELVARYVAAQGFIDAPELSDDASEGGVDQGVATPAE